MAIETVQREAGQIKLIQESEDEKNIRYRKMDGEIIKLEEQEKQYKNLANSVRNEIKAKKKEKTDLYWELESGQETFIPVATAETLEASEGMEMDIPSDEELEEFADDLADELSEETTSDEDMEGGDAEPGEADTYTGSEGDTEKNGENIPENIPTEEPELPQAGEAPLEPDFQLATPDHWRLMDFDTQILLGKVKSKKDPIVGAIYGLPSSLWNKDGKTHYQVQGASVTEEDGEAFWECYVDLLTEAEATLLAAQNNEGAA